MKLMIRLLLGVTLALALAACHTPTAPPASTTQAMQLKLYHVPAQQSTRLAHALQNAIIGNSLADVLKKTRIRVSSPYPGTLMVYAPRSAQESIEHVITELAKASDKAMVSPRLRVRFWVVKAVPGQGTDSPALKPLEKTLDRLRTSLGPSHFVLGEAVAATTSLSSSHPSSITTSRHHTFEFQAEPGTQGGIELTMEFHDVTGQTVPELRTSTTLQPGQYVVLAQAPSATDTGTDAALMNLLVVRIDHPDASS